MVLLTGSCSHIIVEYVTATLSHTSVVGFYVLNINLLTYMAPKISGHLHAHLELFFSPRCKIIFTTT